MQRENPGVCLCLKEIQNLVETVVGESLFLNSAQQNLTIHFSCPLIGLTRVCMLVCTHRMLCVAHLHKRTDTSASSWFHSHKSLTSMDKWFWQDWERAGKRYNLSVFCLENALVFLLQDPQTSLEYICTVAQ